MPAACLPSYQDKLRWTQLRGKMPSFSFPFFLSPSPTRSHQKFSFAKNIRACHHRNWNLLGLGSVFAALYGSAFMI